MQLRWCAYGLEGGRRGKFVEKPRKVLAKRQPLQKFLNKKCPRDHEHLRGWQLNGRISRKTGLCIQALCQAAIRLPSASPATVPAQSLRWRLFE